MDGPGWEATVVKSTGEEEVSESVGGGDMGPNGVNNGRNRDRSVRANLLSSKDGAPP